jgi:hypothetical protein
MAIDMTDSYVKIDIKTDNWQQQVIDAFEGVDAGADISAEDASEMHINPDNNTAVHNANNQGLVVTSSGDCVKVDGSAFLYVNERFSTQQTNQASGLASASNLDKQINAKLSQKLG